MRKLLTILFWVFIFLAVTSLVAVRLAGRSVILDHAGKVKPYACVFRSRDEIREAQRTSDTLIFFFGDSSVAPPPWAGEHGPRIPAILESELHTSRSAPGGIAVIDEKHLLA